MGEKKKVGAVLCYDCRIIHRGTGSAAGRAAVGARHKSLTMLHVLTCMALRGYLETVSPSALKFGVLVGD